MEIALISFGWNNYVLSRFGRVILVTLVRGISHVLARNPLVDVGEQVSTSSSAIGLDDT
jgi:hypothetical protein